MKMFEGRKNRVPRLVVLLFLSFILIVEGYSQEHHIGANYGFNAYSSNSFNSYSQYGLEYEIKYPTEKASVSLEEMVEIFESSNDHSLTYLKTILGFDFNFGKRLHLILGGGISIKFLVENKEFRDNTKPIVFGGKFNVGLRYKLIPRVLISATHQYHFDITPVSTHHSGDERVKFSYLQLSLSYNLIK